MKRNIHKSFGVASEIQHVSWSKKLKLGHVQTQNKVEQWNSTLTPIGTKLDMPCCLLDTVKRENNCTVQTIVRPVGETHNDLMDLDDSRSNVIFVKENLEENYRKDSVLHMAACNFVKKPGHIYHLYERPSGQKYFSMLSHEDWRGHPPHVFLGSWYLEFDQSWIRAEDTVMR